MLTKVREFQYKLLHGAIYTKENLLKFGFVENSQCSFCKQMVETYEHLFWDCSYVKPLWQKVIDRFDLIRLKNAEWKDIHVGIMGKDLSTKCCNTIIFILKYIIFRSRSEDAILTPEEMYRKIRGFRDEEKEIASKRNKLGLHLLKWENIDFEMRN